MSISKCTNIHESVILADLNTSKFLSGANKKVFVFKSTEPPTNLKRVETKFKTKTKTKTSDYIIKVRLKCQDPDVPDQAQHWPEEGSDLDKKGG